jgi:hypothetical protein
MSAGFPPEIRHEVIDKAGHHFPFFFSAALFFRRSAA